MRLAFLLAAVPLFAENPRGRWEGEVGCGAVGHRLGIDLQQLDDGRWSATIDLQDQYARRYRAKSIEVNADNLTLTFPDALPATTLKGVIDRGRISGTWTSSEPALSGTFELRRRAPSPERFREEEVTFRNGDITLRGTLYKPNRRARAPAIVFLHGSGPQTRESYIRYFAEGFARRGFAALIYDKRRTDDLSLPYWVRGAGSFDDLADDGAAAVAFLRARKDVDGSRIGLWGLSQGAWLAPLVAAKSGRIAFAVLLSGGGVTPAEQELYDDEVKLRRAGFTSDEVGRAVALLRMADDSIRDRSDARWRAFQETLEASRNEKWFGLLDRFPLILPRESPAWQNTDLDYDPRAALQKLSAPTLVVLGADDALTPAAETARRIEAAMSSARVEMVPHADHGLWVTINEQCGWAGRQPAERWVERMVTWVTQQTARRQP